MHAVVAGGGTRQLLVDARRRRAATVHGPPVGHDPALEAHLALEVGLQHLVKVRVRVGVRVRVRVRARARARARVRVRVRVGTSAVRSVRSTCALPHACS